MSDSTPKSVADRFAGLETIPLRITVKVGSARCRLGRLAEMQEGEVIPLDREIGEPFELRASEVLLARVDPVAHDDGIAIKVVEIPGDDDDPGS